MVTRARIEVEGFTPEDCIAQLNSAFSLLYGNSISYFATSGVPNGTITFSGSGGEPIEDLSWGGNFSAGVVRVVPKESEFVEEVIESFVTDMGGVRYKARRVIKFVGEAEMPAASPDSAASVTFQVRVVMPNVWVWMDVSGHPEASAWGVIYEAAEEAGHKPNEWSEIEVDGKDLHPLAKVRDVLNSKLVFNIVDDSNDDASR